MRAAAMLCCGRRPAYFETQNLVLQACSTRFNLKLQVVTHLRIWILSDVRCRASDVRHRTIPMLHTMLYVVHVRYRTHNMSYVEHVRHRISMSYVRHVRHLNIRCRTCIRYRRSDVRHRMFSSYTTSYVLSCISYVLAYNIAYDVVYDVVHSIGFGAGFRGLKLHARLRRHRSLQLCMAMYSFRHRLPHQQRQEPPLSAVAGPRIRPAARPARARRRRLPSKIW
jgi:hypothetical protein